MNMNVTMLIVGAVLCAVIGAVITEAKDRGPWEGVFLGGLLGIIGIVIAACLSKELPPAPIGRVAVKCPRCNAVQNVPTGETQYEPF
jgi:uncharacterized membrane protein YeaQ/YmgE (transglycosylase-associated protein family)